MNFTENEEIPALSIAFDFEKAFWLFGMGLPERLYVEIQFSKLYSEMDGNTLHGCK